MTEGQVCPDNEESGSIWPSAAVWMPSPLPYGQKLDLTFLEAPSSATIGRVHADYSDYPDDFAGYFRREWNAWLKSEDLFPGRPIHSSC